jgi:methylmalonyl-CoA carboxyltransferase large subunit
MVKTNPYEPTNSIEDLRKEVELLSARLAELEGRNGTGKPAVATAPPKPAALPSTPEAQGISDEELLAISGALAAYLGVRVHIRQIRLISSPAWAQQGRVFIQASHRLQ